MSASFHIAPPMVLCRQGKRNYNHDRTCPTETDTPPYPPFYLICDGVGNKSGGAAAAETVIQHLQEWFLAHPDRPWDTLFVKQGGMIAKAALQEKAQSETNLRDYSTTLVMGCLTPENQLLIAWAGDSFALHIRAGFVRFQTHPHTLIQELLDNGSLTPAEAQNHPLRNVISRFVSADWKPNPLDTHLLTDLQPGDVILFGSDGILEAFSPEELASWLQPAFWTSAEDLKERIREKCETHSKDNYSLILLKLEEAR